jgi:hypothetical protein
MSLVLLLKIVLAPTLVASASLLGRRFGPRVSGWLIGFPVVGGPILWFYAREQGAEFAARAAAATLLGLLSLCVFLLVYAWSARRFGWLPTVLLGWAAFLAATLAIDRAPWLAHAPWPVGLPAAGTGLAITMLLLPRLPSLPASRRPRYDLALRLVATALLVLTLTGVAHLLGPGRSGLVTPFPVATSILVVFAHRQAGPGAVLAVYAGFIPSLYSFASFCAALSFCLMRWSVPVAFALAMLVTSLCQIIVLKMVNRGTSAGGS